MNTCKYCGKETERKDFCSPFCKDAAWAEKEGERLAGEDEVVSRSWEDYCLGEIERAGQ